MLLCAHRYAVVCGWTESPGFCDNTMSERARGLVVLRCDAARRFPNATLVAVERNRSDCRTVARRAAPRSILVP